MRGILFVALVALVGCSGSSSVDAGPDAVVVPDAIENLDRYCSAACGGTATTCAEDEVCVCLGALFPTCVPNGPEECIWPTSTSDACPAGEQCPEVVATCEVGETCAITIFGVSDSCVRSGDEYFCNYCIAAGDDAGTLPDAGGPSR